MSKIDIFNCESKKMGSGIMGYGMMQGYGYGYWNFLSILLLIGLVILVYLWIIKLWKETFKKTK